jgi:hypothetical protein
LICIDLSHFASWMRPHAPRHLNLLIEALRQAGVTLSAKALDRSLHILKRRGPHLLVRLCDCLPEPIIQQKTVQKHLTYFRKRLLLMQYPLYQQQGWPIGSGMVGEWESANKVVVHARRVWGWHAMREPINVNSMLALRTAVCTERSR